MNLNQFPQQPESDGSKDFVQIGLFVALLLFLNFVRKALYSHVGGVLALLLLLGCIGICFYIFCSAYEAINSKHSADEKAYKNYWTEYWRVYNDVERQIECFPANGDPDELNMLKKRLKHLDSIRESADAQYERRSR